MRSERPGRFAIAIAAATACLGLGAAAAMGGPASERIVGGEVADPAEWQFAAALETKTGDQFCGGSVISADAILTAAHCVNGAPPNQLRVVTGRPDLSNESVGQTLKVEKVFVTRQYRRQGRRDIAVLRLESPTSAPPVGLASAVEDDALTAEGAEMRVAGWGATQPNGAASSSVLRDVSTFAVKARRCDNAFRGFFASEEICTVGAPLGENNTSSCYGDSGGPLVAGSGSGLRLVGAVSYGGIRCGVKKPTVYARVAANLNFIQDKAGFAR
jgi:trypsin